MAEFTHFNASGEAHMVDVGSKPSTERTARVEGAVMMQLQTLDMILKGDAKKGDVIGTARIAGIMACKRTHELIPLCHPLPVSKVTVDIEENTEENRMDVTGTVKVTGQTGVEMEALTAVSVTCLTLYDMVKAVDRGIRIGDIRLVEKTGGKSGTFQAD